MSLAQIVLCIACTKPDVHKLYTWPQAGYTAKRICNLPPQVDECSGAVAWTDSTFITLNDDGPAVLYEVSYTGRLVRTIPVPKAENRDWEDLATDGNGTLFIGDVGNNFNLRRDLVLYQFTPGSGMPARKISLSYPDQKDFPPDKQKLNFDCEAVFYRDGNMYLVSKNRGSHQVRIYTASTQTGNHTAILADSPRLYRQVTGATLNPSANTLALASYGGVYIYNLNMPGSYRLLGVQIASLAFKNSGQVEAVWFINDTDFCLANEEGVVWQFTRSTTR